jgi:uncharacterized Zn-finger protein
MIFFKKHQCKECDKKFSKIEDLMHHQQIVHNKDLLYDCKKCNKFFSSMEEMRTHLQKFHSYKKDNI